ncbi:MAG: helix-hairpin-helix domain-containing protein [Winogradskyella sp.]|uniref:ComEA family DNA-binding protein n=1 Tax=Winogradskyella sp. TaxID=1883156 RepID=UPI000F3BD268|nr:helix-hairpin-helix domain-containing protein [Winogradskyella sp.]RNC84966.1 MAG: helix-hairpin-helix domain-containing protein [Winogradskyella sp.]
MKSHFKFSKKKQSGIFSLVILIIVVQSVYFFLDFPFNSKHDSSNDIAIESYKNEIDSLRQLALQNKTPKIYPFNPNFISDYKGYALGMSNEEIDRLHAFRANNKWVNSAIQFQEVTKVSDSFLAEISPYFKFPDWVTNPKPKKVNQLYNNVNVVKSFEQKIDLNIATSSQLQKVYGIGEKLSANIIKYRNTYGGFINEIELSEIWGLTPEVIERVNQQFTVKTPRSVETFNLNFATRAQLVTIPHIDYEIANNIIEERTLRDGFSAIEDLTKVEQFPLKKLQIIKLYLHL